MRQVLQATKGPQIKLICFFPIFWQIIPNPNKNTKSVFTTMPKVIYGNKYILEAKHIQQIFCFNYLSWKFSYGISP